MRSFKSIMLKWLSVVVMCMTITSCNVSEDVSDCVVNLQITFNFTKNNTNHFGSEVSSLSVFVFDKQDKFVGRWDENDNTKFNTNYTMSLHLQPETYSFVVWGGLKDDCYYLCAPGQTQSQSANPVVGKTTKSEIIVRLKCDSRNSYSLQKHYVDYIPSALFFGSTGQHTFVKNADSSVTVDLVKNSKRMDLSIIGMTLPTTRANKYPHMDITLNSPNGGYDFVNTIEAGCDIFTYTQHNPAGGGAGTQTSTMYTMQMKSGQDPVLSIYNTETGSSFFSVKMIEDILSKIQAYASQEAIDAEDEFDITIDFRPAVGAMVTVNGWNVEISGSIIQ